MVLECESRGYESSIHQCFMCLWREMMASNRNLCSRCGLYKGEYPTDRLGSGRRPTCLCPRPTARRRSTRQTPTQSITRVSSTGDECAKCGKGPPRLGGHYGPDAFCGCIEITGTSTPRAARRNPVPGTPASSIIEQLEMLLNLRLHGALTEEEFRTLKSRLFNGDV